MYLSRSLSQSVGFSMEEKGERDFTGFFAFFGAFKFFFPDQWGILYLIGKVMLIFLSCAIYDINYKTS